MKHKKNLFLCLIAILAIFSVVSCDGNKLPDVPSVNPDKPVELPLKESANLDAWRTACEENSDAVNSTKDNPDERDINVKVTGTVTTRTTEYPYNMYLTDEKGGAMFVYGDLKDCTAKPGDKVTLTATKLMRFNGGFQTKSQYVTINNVEAGTAIEPKLITDQASFNALGEDTNLDYVKVIGRVATNSNKGNIIVNILDAVPEDFTGFENMDNVKPLDDAKIEVRTQKGVSVEKGDVCVFVGQMAAYNGTKQLMAFEAEKKYEMPPQWENKTFADYFTVLEANEAKTELPVPYRVKGVVANTSEKYLVIVEPETSNSIVCYASNGYDSSALTVGKETYVVLKNVDYYNKAGQCSSFTVEEHPADAKDYGVDTLRSWAKKIANKAEFDAAIGEKQNRTFVTVDLKVDSQNTGKKDGQTVFYGIYAKFDPTDEHSIYFKDANLTYLEKDDTFTAYGVMSVKKIGKKAPYKYVADISNFDIIETTPAK